MPNTGERKRSSPSPLDTPCANVAPLAVTPYLEQTSGERIRPRHASRQSRQARHGSHGTAPRSKTSAATTLTNLTPTFTVHILRIPRSPEAFLEKPFFPLAAFTISFKCAVKSAFRGRQMLRLCSIISVYAHFTAAVRMKRPSDTQPASTCPTPPRRIKLSR